MAKASSRNIKRYVSDLTGPEPRKLRAVALQYDLDKGKAPKVIAAAKGKLAEEVLRIAEENRIPLYEDPILTDLLAKLEVDSEIPAELYTMVAEVLAFVYQLDKMAKKRVSFQKGKKNA